MRIFRISNILSFTLATLFGVLLFWTSQAVQRKEDTLKDLKKELTTQKEASRVLGVEWDYLNRPQRLEKLAHEQLGMERPTSGGIARSIEDVPEPVIVNVTPDFYEEGSGIMEVSTSPPTPEKPKAGVVPSPETVSPATAEKQSFDRLIESLDQEGGKTP